MPREGQLCNQKKTSKAVYIRTEHHQIIVMPSGESMLQQIEAAKMIGAPFSIDLDKVVFVGVLTGVEEAIQECQLDEFSTMHAAHAQKESKND